MKKMFSRLWVRLSVAFTVVTLVVFLITAIAGQTIVNPRFARSPLEDNLNRPGEPLRQLAEFYREHRSWDGIAGLFESDPLSPFRDLLLIMDSDRQVVYGTPQTVDSGSPGAGPPLAPIIDAGVIVGYAGFSRGASGVALLQEGALLRMSRDLALTAMVGGLIGVLVGIVFSRGLSAPLNRLASAARAIGAGQLTQRVKVEGSEEMTALAQAFNDMADQLEEAEKLRRNLVADVAHELRTPLSVLQGNLQAILDDVYTLDKGEITRLYDQTRLLSRLVDDLRLLSQSDAGLLILDVQPVDLAHLVSEQIEAFRVVAGAKAITLVAEIPQALPPVQADAPRISQVLHNLLDNALRYTPQGGAISVRMGCEGARLWLAVQDSGTGIRAEHLAYLFDRFYRVDETRNRVTGGTGLGLAIARSIVRAHGGEIGVSSDGIPGHGSTFTVWLPVDRQPVGEVEKSTSVQPAPVQ